MGPAPQPDSPRSPGFASPRSSARGPAGSEGASATAVLLRKLRRELHASRQLSKLHVLAASGGQEAWLLRRAADCLTRLLAAGAPPATPDDAAGFAPADWAAVAAAATRPITWAPATQRLFPRPFRRAARELLLVARRGFTVPVGDGGSSSGCGSSTSTSCSESTESDGGGSAGSPHSPRLACYWLDGGVVEVLIRQLARAGQAQQ